MNMIDSMGYGIYNMLQEQRRRFFPLPQYNLQDPDKVELVIYGHSIDEKYSKLLLRNTDLPLFTIILLDRFQKNLNIPEQELKNLKKAGLIEGRKPNYHISEKVAVQTGQLRNYIINKGFDDEYYQKMILELIKVKKSGISRKEIAELIWHKLPAVLDERQKQHKINNLIQKLRTTGKMINKGTRNEPIWIISEVFN